MVKLHQEGWTHHGRVGISMEVGRMRCATVGSMIGAVSGTKMGGQRAMRMGV